MPVLNSEAPAFTPGRQDKKEAKIEQFESSPEEIKNKMVFIFEDLSYLLYRK